MRERIQIKRKDKTNTINKILENELKEILEIESTSIFTHKIINDNIDESYDSFKKAVLSSFPHLNENYKSLIEYAKNNLENQQVEQVQS